jgi:hypothetical protein
VPHGILRVSNANLYENEFQNPQIQQTISLFPEQSTLDIYRFFHWFANIAKGLNLCDTEAITTYLQYHRIGIYGLEVDIVIEAA